MRFDDAVRFVGRGDTWRWPDGSVRLVTGRRWSEDLAQQWNQALEKRPRHIRLDISEIAFVTLFEWVGAVAAMERIVSTRWSESITIDLVDSDHPILLPVGKWREAKGLEPQKRPPDYDFSNRVYTVAGFLESLDTLAILNRPGQRGSVAYRWMDGKTARTCSSYTRADGQHTVVLAPFRVQTKEDCKEFLSDGRIADWMMTMAARYSDRPIFKSEEIWRVVCHELAVNIWEHSGTTGFVAARVVESPCDQRNRPLGRWRATYPDIADDLLPPMRDGFLEVCVADGGQGFIETLGAAYRSRAGAPENATIIPKDVLAFAFDELGTRKQEAEIWATQRHALGRILQLVERYGGALTLRSDGWEIAYASKGDHFVRRANCLGYEPTGSRQLGSTIGSQLQLLLPLVPIVEEKPQHETLLVQSLPGSYRIESKHVRGHLVPLLEVLDKRDACVGAEEQREFREACTRLAVELLEKRPATEPFVLDFSGIGWTPAQFETLLYMLHNLVTRRAVLLVEIDCQLAGSVVSMERTAEESTLVFPGHAGGAQRPYFDEPSERLFMETYSRVGATVLGLDTERKRHIFGLRDGLYEAPLLSLIDTPASIRELCETAVWDGELDPHLLRIILRSNPLFKCSKARKWSTVWGPQDLHNETSRALSRHFDKVAERSEAWRGRTSTASRPVYDDEIQDETGVPRSRFDTGEEVFDLPWQREWCEEFLESSRILTRGRQVDEAAQRLVYRLRRVLESNGKSLDEVKALVVSTAPAMMLAIGIYKWWPFEPRPAVVELSYSALLHGGTLPSIAGEAGIVIVQDVLDRQVVSSMIAEALREQGATVLCVLSLVRFREGLGATRATSVDEFDWLPDKGPAGSESIPVHAMIEVQRPRRHRPLSLDEDDQGASWVEPRALVPVSYRSLRRERPEDKYLELRDKFLHQFDGGDAGGGQCHFAAGHYAYGSRHYPVVVDVRAVLQGEIGNEIAEWLADVCEGRQPRDKPSWESDEGFALRGDVTVVLMPLHSQIHYLWPRVEIMLARRGRRQPMWLLPATLFSGQGPAYRMPFQFRYQLRAAVHDLLAASKSRTRLPQGLRILVIDDAIASGRTAKTILTRILVEIERAFRDEGYPVVAGQKAARLSPVEWIRYFAVLNEMGYADHRMWHSTTSIGRPPIPFVFEEYAPFMGMPVYDVTNCPICQERIRLERLEEMCKQRGNTLAHKWVSGRLDDLRPVAIDGPNFQARMRPETLPPIDVFALRPESAGKHASRHADTAIWRFHELMYMSYPPSDVLHSLKYAWPQCESDADQTAEYERYRWSVLSWCLRNWPRVEMNTAEASFRRCVWREVKRNSGLVERLLEACSTRYDSPEITLLVACCVKALARLERRRTAHFLDTDRAELAESLLKGLNLFWLGIPSGLWDTLTVGKPGGPRVQRLKSLIGEATHSLDPNVPSVLRTLHLELESPQLHWDPRWGLKVVSENLFRGRDPEKDKPFGSHYLLPGLIWRVQKDPAVRQKRIFLQQHLSIFMRGLEHIAPYAFFGEDVLDVPGIREKGKAVSRWLSESIGASAQVGDPPAELDRLGQDLLLDAKFVVDFNRIFHWEVEAVKAELDDYAAKTPSDAARFVFQCRVEEDAAGCRVLTLVPRLIMCIENIAINPINELSVRDPNRTYLSRVEIHRLRKNGQHWVAFRVLTGFRSFDEAKRRLRQSPNIRADLDILELFGGEFDPEVALLPSEGEQDEGFTVLFDVRVPVGYSATREASG